MDRIKSFLKNSLLNDHFILAVILFNSLVIYLQESGWTSLFLLICDYVCTLIFVSEMIVKHVHLGVRGYWRDHWNRLDGVLVIISLPSLVLPFLDASVINFSVVLTLRLLRVLRLFRVLHFFPNISQLIAGLKRAMRVSWIVLVGFGLAVIIFGMVNCSLYSDVAPQYFGTPLRSIYTVFRVFTVEGWYEIPDTIAAATSPTVGILSRLYFCLQMASFGIFGLSLINSIFVDAMVEDNNDDLREQLERLEQKLDRLTETMQRNNSDNPQPNK